MQYKNKFLCLLVLELGGRRPGGRINFRCTWPKVRGSSYELGKVYLVCHLLNGSFKTETKQWGFQSFSSE